MLNILYVSAKKEILTKSYSRVDSLNPQAENDDELGT